MIDIRLIRKDREGIEAKIRNKDPEADFSRILELDHEIRELKTRVEGLKAERNEASQLIGEMKRRKEDPSSHLDKVSGMAAEIHSTDARVSALEAEFRDALSRIPNIPMDDIKVSQDPNDNVLLKEVGVKPEFDFPFKNHLELNEGLHLFDFKRGAKIAGTSWPVYCNWGARLEWALINYMISVNIKNGYQQWIPPIVVRPDVMFGSGQLPKFENQQFRVKDEDFDLFMIPTAEVSLNGLHIDEILEPDTLPLRYMAYTPCFRREAGAAGAQERGLIRMHQFNKVEMFCLTKPEESVEMSEEMIRNSEEILNGLQLHYRNMLLVTGDMSFASARTVDIEVWLPGQNRYYEVSSVSNCTDYQSRRSNIRFRRAAKEKPELVHTLNGSALATSRLLVAILENNQNCDGSVNVPEVLQSYLGGIKKLEPVA